MTTSAAAHSASCRFEQGATNRLATTCEHCMLQGFRAPRGAYLSEPLAEAQPLPHRPHRRYRPHPRRPLSFQRSDIDTFAA